MAKYKVNMTEKNFGVEDIREVKEFAKSSAAA